jgi:type II secretory pathway predicted ATPase ExeA
VGKHDVEHLHHFGLAEDPFRSDAAEKFDVELPSQQEALARVDRGVRQGRGFVVLVGGVGAGKSRVARQLYDGLEEEQFEAAMMVVLRREVGAEWLLARIARQLGVERAESDREAVIRQIYERLAIIHEDGRRAVLIIDDAHGLANADTLSELCGLVKLEYEERRLVTVVLVGAPPLDAAIAADPLVSHHVEVRVPLAPLTRPRVPTPTSGCPVRAPRCTSCPVARRAGSTRSPTTHCTRHGWRAARRSRAPTSSARTPISAGPSARTLLRRHGARARSRPNAPTRWRSTSPIRSSTPYSSRGRTAASTIPSSPPRRRRAVSPSARASTSMTRSRRRRPTTSTICSWSCSTTEPVANRQRTGTRPASASCRVPAQARSRAACEWTSD